MLVLLNFFHWNYNNASLCVENHKEKCSQTTVFNIALSGIDELCHEKEQDVLQHRECLESHSGTVLNGCDSVCHFTDFMIMLSGKGDAQRLKKLEADKEALQKETGSACTAFGCMSSCVAREFNMNCSPLGSIIVEALTKPFFTIATIFEEIGPRAKISIYRQVPPQCYYLVNYEEIRGLSAGKAPNKVLFKNPEEAILNEITTREEMKSRKKAELEKQFLMEAQMG
ncbi:hypothetical protein NECAME_05747 [Necator americanus]|uniref:Chondroitin proteoglycan 4 domain-containing protein n=1 Tax=Necator americanus TaxID=51031 RepID=W2U0Y7_NECAM|nr:hypothetical protein NECAME_05747 [Necator americanus]ETN87026.1 hypothetical protein NECAME_05747 [Necator americanus]